MDKAASSGKKPRMAAGMPGESLRPLYLISEEPSSASMGDAASDEEFAFKQIAPFEAFKELLAAEVSNYLTGGISSFRCALCPFREFSRPCRVRLRVENYHCARYNWRASGGEHLKLCASLYDNDNDLEKNESGYAALPNIWKAVFQTT